MGDKPYKFKDIDVEGMVTLEAIDKADHFNEWMYQTIKPFCGKKILEIGSGIGNISKYFVRDGYDITLTDIRSNYCEILSEKFSQSPVIQMDLVHEDFDNKYSNLFDSFDTVYALNVVEHIKDDNQAIINAKKLLKKDGTLVILVPAYQCLFNGFDVSLEHYRRYNITQLNTLMSAHTSIVHSQYFNAAGIFGWVLSGSILKKQTIPEGQMSIFNKLVFVFKLMDKIIFNKIGLSVISVGRK
jgi:2-polyprenyl-3-methyl-5-hydroxy-6-metoxy-1,4-benzoquinol methylase